MLCKICEDRKFFVVNDHTVKPCVCIYASQLRRHLGEELSASPIPVSSSLLDPTISEEGKFKVDRTGENLILSGYWEDVKAHLKWALGCKGISFSFRLTTDERLKSVYLGQEAYTSRSRKLREETDTYNSLADYLGSSVDLVILRIGFLGYKNQAMPGILKESLLLRYAIHKPTWVVIDKTNPFSNTFAYSSDVESFLAKNFETVDLSPVVNPSAAQVGYSKTRSTEEIRFEMEDSSSHHQRYYVPEDVGKDSDILSETPSRQPWKRQNTPRKNRKSGDTDIIRGLEGVITVKRILRSLIDTDNGKTAPNNVYADNFRFFLESSVEPTREDDSKIWEFVSNFYRNRFSPPSLEVVTDYFKAFDDVEVLTRLAEYAETPFYSRSNFEHIVCEIRDEHQRTEFVALCQLSSDIVRKGVILKDGYKKTHLKGLNDAIAFLTKKSGEFLTFDHNERTRGNFRDDAEEGIAEYEGFKLSDASSRGRLCGLDGIDNVIRGGKGGQLWIHAAYVGELKTTFALNYAYNQVVRYGSNVFYASLEMPYEDLRRQIICMHSAHPKFGRKPFSFEHVENALLQPEEEKFYKEVWKDFSENPDYGDFHCWCPTEDTTTVRDIRREAEMVNRESDLGMIIIDHGGLLDPEKGFRTKDYTVQLNSVIRSAKKLALHFNHGAKIFVLLLFQINREGKDYADKNGGRYKLRHLSYANEAERSADIVSTSYLNEDLRRDGIAIFDNLKRRAGPLFPPLQVRVQFEQSKLYNMEGFSGPGTLTPDDHRTTLNMLSSL